MLDGSPDVLRDVAMATNFVTKIATTGFVRTIATTQLVMCRGLYGVHIGATWRIRLNRPSVAAIRPYVKLL